MPLGLPHHGSLLTLALVLRGKKRYTKVSGKQPGLDYDDNFLDESISSALNVSDNMRFPILRKQREQTRQKLWVAYHELAKTAKQQHLTECPD